MITPIAAIATTNKSKTPIHKESKAKKVIDDSIDSVESSQAQAKKNTKQKAAHSKDSSSYDSSDDSVD